MEKSLLVLAAVVFLGGFSDAALTEDASTQSYYLLNITTTTAESVTEDHSTDRPTPTTAQTTLSTTTVRDKQLENKNTNKEDSKEDTKKKEEPDVKKTGEEKTTLGKIEQFSFYMKE